MQQIASAIAIATGENWNQTQLNINFNCVFIKYLFSIEYQFVSEVTIVTIEEVAAEGTFSLYNKH